ncbi:hypothetical protein [Paenibacillus solani]|uniref:hypothetical protein n=1 Tax=Paenibacillus solani TaxID=1705565 RepID=UPI000A5B8FB0|nr:hypothetical protein [Paenibacillus solani]
MNFKKIKKLTVLSSVLLGTLVLSGSALAASSVSGSLDQYTPTSGSVSLGVDSATATTTCQASNCSVTAKATYYYYFGSIGSPSDATSTNSGHVGVTAKASSGVAPTRAIRGEGTHKASNGVNSWGYQQEVKTVVYP